MSRPRFRLHLACALGAALLAVPGYAATAALVRDLFDAPQVQASRPREFVANGSRALFVATTPEHGDEPWVTDGTPAGTRLLADIEPGRGDGQPADISCAAPFGDGFLLLWPSGPATASGGRTLALWRRDGTPGGTAEVATLDAVGGCAMVALGGRVLFTVSRAVADATWALELWTSDGTAAGTRRLASFADRAERVLPLQRVGDTLYLAADDGIHGEELWRIALDNGCASDCDRDGRVTVDELIAAVRAALDGCF